jgi:MFS family permease
MFAAFIGVILNFFLPLREITQWGWRIPLLLGCLMIPMLFRFRSSLEETDEFANRESRQTSSEIRRSLVSNWRLVAAGTLMVTMTTVSFYMITAYTPTFGSAVLHVSAFDSLIVTLCVGASNLFWLPVMGALSDKVGRRPLLILCALIMLLTAYPSLLWLVHKPSFASFLAVELWVSFIYASYNGAMIVFLVEIMPADVKTSGFSLAYSLATALFGGFTPAICTYLIHRTGNRAVPGLWLAFASICGLIAALLVKPPQRSAVGDQPILAVGANE